MISTNLRELARRLREGVASDMPRSTMLAVAGELAALADQEEIGKCPWCGETGLGFADADKPSAYCGHDPALVRPRSGPVGVLERVEPIDTSAERVENIGADRRIDGVLGRDQPKEG